MWILAFETFFGSFGSTGESLTGLSWFDVSMATKTSSKPDITVLEFGRLEDTIDARIRDGQRDFSVGELVETAEISEPKVREAMRHLQGKYDYILQIGSGEWHFDVPLEGDEDDEEGE